MIQVILKSVPILFFSIFSFGETSTRFLHPKHLYAVGDIHENYNGLVSIVEYLGLINSQVDWSPDARDVHIAFMGDIMDRRDSTRICLNLLYRLKQQAEKYNSHVTILMGNHDFQGYGEATKQDVINYGDFLGAVDSIRKLNSELINTKELYEMQYDLAFESRTRYSLELSKRPTIVIVGDILFVHAGIDEKLLEYTPNQINEAVNYLKNTEYSEERSEEIPLSLQRWVESSDGPLKNRNLAYDTHEEDQFIAIAKVLWGMEAAQRHATKIANFQKAINHLTQTSSPSCKYSLTVEISNFQQERSIKVFEPCLISS